MILRSFPTPDILGRLEALLIVCRIRAMIAGRMAIPTWEPRP